MDLQLKGKTVFISGSTSGIGFCVAKIFLYEQAIVFINGRTDQSIAKAIQRLKDDFPNGVIKGIVADFSNSFSFEHLIKQLPKVDILINNVGTYSTAPAGASIPRWREHPARAVKQTPASASILLVPLNKLKSLPVIKCQFLKLFDLLDNFLHYYTSNLLDQLQNHS